MRCVFQGALQAGILSAAQFRQADLPQLVAGILEEARPPAHLLELEQTEGVAMVDPNAAIDDFGTGYSSLNYFKKFKVSKVKIDQSFVRDIAVDLYDRANVGAIISIAKSRAYSPLPRASRRANN